MNLRILKYLIPRKMRRTFFGNLNYVLSLPERIYFTRKLKKHTPVLVLQMGKVGSTSITNSLKKFYPGASVHCHNFSSGYIINWRVPALYAYREKTGCPLKIISPVREPVSRNISAFFHDRALKYRLPLLENPQKHIQKLKDDFLNHYGTQKIDTWFDNQILSNFGIDVYNQPFPKDTGYQKISHNNIELLIMQIELPDATKEKIIQEFTGLEKFQLQKEKVGSKQEYGKFYQYFKQTIRLPQSYITRLLNTKYFTHFYDEKMAQKIREKWAE